MEIEILFKLLLALIACPVYLFIQGLIINGIRISATKDMIFEPVYNYLTRRKNCKIFYKDELLNDFITHLVKNSVLRFEDKYEMLEGYLIFPDSSHRNSFTNRFKADYNDHIVGDAVLDIEGVRIKFYVLDEGYVFSKWIRKPIIQCVVCMASFWGIFTFLIPALVMLHFSPIVLPLYVVNTFALSAVNKIIYKAL